MRSCGRFAIVLFLAVAGCHWAGKDGPIPRSLDTSRQLSQQGVEAIEHGQWDRAENLLGQAVKACPTNPDAHRHYGESLWNRGEKSQAIRHVEQAIKLAPDDASLYARLADMRLDVGQADIAMTLAERAVDLDPKSWYCWSARGRVMQAKRRMAEALADYQRALHYDPQNRELLVDIAGVYRELGQLPRALASLQSAAEAYPPGEEPQPLLAMQGRVYSDLKRFDDAAKVLDAACARQPASAELLTQFAEVRAAQGQTQAAVALARRAQSLAPEHAGSRYLLERLETPPSAEEGPQTAGRARATDLRR